MLILYKIWIIIVIWFRSIISTEIKYYKLTNGAVDNVSRFGIVSICIENFICFSIKERIRVDYVHLNHYHLLNTNFNWIHNNTSENINYGLEVSKLSNTHLLIIDIRCRISQDELPIDFYLAIKVSSEVDFSDEIRMSHNGFEWFVESRFCCLE